MALDYVEISSNYTRKRDTLDRERLARISHVKKRRNHPKRHATNKERSHEDRMKHAATVKRQKEWIAAREAFLMRARAYWKGLGDHP